MRLWLSACNLHHTWLELEPFFSVKGTTLKMSWDNYFGPILWRVGVCDTHLTIDVKWWTLMDDRPIFGINKFYTQSIQNGPLVTCNRNRRSNTNKKKKIDRPRKSAFQSSQPRRITDAKKTRGGLMKSTCLRLMAELTVHLYYGGESSIINRPAVPLERSQSEKKEWIVDAPFLLANIDD